MALAAQWLESMLPLLIPAVPVRVGIANIFVLYAMLALSPVEGLLVTVLRTALLPLITGNVSGMLYGMAGSLLAWGLMFLTSGLLRKGFVSEIGLSVSGAAGFQVGQCLAGHFVVGRVIWMYFPLMMLLAIPAGIITGWLCSVLLKRLGISNGPERVTRQENAE